MQPCRGRGRLTADLRDRFPSVREIAIFFEHETDTRSDRLGFTTHLTYYYLTIKHGESD